MVVEDSRILRSPLCRENEVGVGVRRTWKLGVSSISDEPKRLIVYPGAGLSDVRELDAVDDEGNMELVGSESALMRKRRRIASFSLLSASLSRSVRSIISRNLVTSISSCLV